MGIFSDIPIRKNGRDVLAGWFNVLRTAGIAAETPPALVLDYAGSSAPTGYLLCDGSAVSRTTYADLFAIIGTTYGEGDGSTTFNVPNLVGRDVDAEVLFHCNFEDGNATADHALGVAAPIVDTGTIVTKNASEQYNQDTGEFLDWAYLNNAGLNVGGLGFWYTPSYSGGTTSGGDQVLRFDHQDGSESTFDFILNHTPGARIEIQMNTVAGVGTLTDIGAWSPTADQEYYFEIYWDTVAGKVYVFIDGVLVGGAALTLTNAGSRATPTANSTIHFDGVESPDEYWIDNVTTWDSVRFTANHAAPSKASTELTSFISVSEMLPVIKT